MPMPMPTPGYPGANNSYQGSTAGGYPAYPPYPANSTGGYPGASSNQSYPSYPSYTPAATQASASE